MAAIRKVQCNSQRLPEVMAFFTGLGFKPTAKSIPEPPASGMGTLMHVSLGRRSFDPWKLQPDQLRAWRELPLEVVRPKE